MFKFLPGTLVTALLLSACATPPLSQSADMMRPVALSGAQERTVQDAIKKSLKDPESARFEGMVASEVDSEVTIVCGWLNAKNSFGGYTGKQPFGGRLIKVEGSHSFTNLTVGNNKSTSRFVHGRCRRYGLSLAT